MLFLLLIVLFAVLSAKSWTTLLIEVKRFNIPGPQPVPLIGNGYLFLGKPTRFLKVLHRLSQQYGDIVRIHLFSSPYVLMYHPKHIETIISSNELIVKGRSYNYLEPWLGQGLLTANGNRWRAHRKFLTPAFHYNILQNFLPVFCKNDKILIEKLNKLADGQPISLFPIIALAALDNVAESVMGVSFNAQRESESKYVKAINDLALIVAERMRNPFIQPEAFFNLTSYKSTQDKAIKILRAHSQSVIDTRRKELQATNVTEIKGDSEIGLKNKHAFLDLLLLAEINGKKIDDKSVIEEVETFMFEGHDTTTSGICFSLFCISSHRDVQDKLFMEQQSVLGEDLQRDPSYNELKEMKYLELTIKESMRLYPSVPLIERKITKDTNIGDHKLIKGTSVIMDLLHMQRHPDVYDDPLEFRPERFDGANKINPFDWIPFSAGPRNCIGQKFAMMEMKVIIAAIIKNFEILPVPKDPELCADLILRSYSGVFIKLLPRTPY